MTLSNRVPALHRNEGAVAKNLAEAQGSKAKFFDSQGFLATKILGHDLFRTVFGILFKSKRNSL